MKLVGYTDRLGVAAGETIQFMVSSEHPSYRVDLVRLIHGDENAEGPGFKEREVPAPVAGEYPGRPQAIHSGSYVHVIGGRALDALRSFTVAAWIFPTTPAKGVQGLMAHWVTDPVPQGFALIIGAGGDLCLWLADGSDSRVEVATGTTLLERAWTFVAASCDANSGRVVVSQQPARHWPVDRGRAAVEQEAAARMRPPSGAPLLMAALEASGPGRQGPVTAPYNGKIDGPRLLSRALPADALAALAHGGSLRDLDDDVLAAWNFSDGIAGHRVTDAGPHALHGETVNLPTRAVTGHNWTGAETSFRSAPGEYGAIHFHDDDLEDAGWDVDFSLTVPPDLPSGVYAARLRAGDDEDYLPFCVRPPRGTATARVAVLMPTITYVAYANFRDIDGGFWDHERVPNADPSLHREEYAYIRANGLPGMYERHSDGSGTAYVSHLRPILNMRPKFRYRVWAAPARFPADLYLIDWLEAMGHDADIITDHDLHAEGAALLAPYGVVLTGSHPEYWTSCMLSGLESYLEQGGRLMYLGGNGFFGVTSMDPERPYIIEVRRWGTSWPFEMSPGERCHSTTGEPGGTWRNRGRAPQGLVGVGSCAAGFDRGSAYVRQPESFDARAAFIFEGIGDDEPVGDFPSLVVRHGPAGYEMDRLDHGLGTPPHTLLLASSVGHSDRYAAFTDEVLAFRQGKDGVLPTDPPVPGDVHPFIRADMVYFETPNGGAVFSVGSIAWRASLSYNGYENNVSRITGNVLRRFASDASPP